MERVGGIEPPCAAWKAAVLPLNYTRMVERAGRRPRKGRGEIRGIWGRCATNRNRVVRRRSRCSPDRTSLQESNPEGSAEGGWWGKQDSNLRRLSHQIYSLTPLAAREFPRPEYPSPVERRRQAGRTADCGCANDRRDDRSDRVPSLPERAARWDAASPGMARSRVILESVYVLSERPTSGSPMAIGRCRSWWGQRRDSNPQPADYKSAALPIEPHWRLSLAASSDSGGFLRTQGPPERRVEREG